MTSTGGNINNFDLEYYLGISAQPRTVSLVFRGKDTRLLRDSLSKGADPNQTNDEGIPALYLALQNGYDEVVGVLMEAGAVLNESVFVNICINLNDHGMAELLVQLGVLNRLSESQKVDFFLWAAENNSVSLIPSFLASGIDVDSKDSQGLSALHKAITSPIDCTSIIELLLVAKADPDLTVFGHSKTNRSPLHLAALATDPLVSSKTTHLLLEAGGNCNVFDSSKTTPLHYAVSSKNNGTAKLLLSAGASMNERGGWMGRTPLMFAIIERNEEGFDMLLESGCDIHAIDWDNSSAVGHAVFAHSKNPSPYMLWSLLMLGGDPNSGAGIWKYPLHTDLNYGGGRFSKILIFFGADVNVKGLQYGSALAIAASDHCSPEITKMLLDAGADVHGNCSDALRHAVIYGNSNDRSQKHAELLLDAGADVNGDLEGTSILECAIIMHRSNIIPLLINYGASADMVKWAPLNPLGHIREGGYLTLPDMETLKIMLRHDAKISNKEVAGMEYTPLHAASRDASLSFVKLLLEAGADCHDKCLKYSMTPLHYVSGSGSEFMGYEWRGERDKETPAAAIISILLDYHASPLEPDKLGRLPLHYASKSGKFEVVKLLLLNGNSHTCSITDNSGVTALHLAASPEIVAVLIEHGASLLAKDKLGRTPLQAATRRQNQDVCMELLRYHNNEELKECIKKPRGNDSVVWYCYMSFRHRMIRLLFKSSIRSTQSKGDVTSLQDSNNRTRRTNDDISSFSAGSELEISDKEAENAISLKGIRIGLLVVLFSILLWNYFRV